MMKKIVLILLVLAIWLIAVPVSAGATPFAIEPGKIIGYNIKPGSEFSFPITIRNNSDAAKTFMVATRVPDILSEGYAASDGTWITLPQLVEVSPGSSAIITACVTAPAESHETWIGIAEDKTGLRYELITKVMINTSKFGLSSLGTVKYSQPGEKRQYLIPKVPVIMGAVIFALLVSMVVTVLLVRRNRHKILNAR